MAEVKTEAELRAALDAERLAYHDAANTETAPQLRERTVRIKALAADLAAVLGAGCRACPVCGGPATALLKTPEIGGKNPHPAVYEVGCAAVTAGDKPHPPTRARHWTLAGAKEKWNKGALIASEASVVAPASS